MVDASCSATELSQLIDDIMVASTSAASGDAQYIEKTLELFESLKKVKVTVQHLTAYLEYANCLVAISALPWNFHPDQ